ncbi:MAG: ferredoxin, partial [Gemmatimonadetes bacterium]|nr:ferredoxin [Gemmatimonadota bacterium]
ANALLSKDGQGLPTILAAVTGDSPAPASVAVPADAETPAAPVEKVKAEEEPPPEPEVKLGEGFIDSPLCTSCHDCINMNPRMFQYDGNKQAVLADATAGTYAQLVKAAEACPARCIVPGAPREDDATASPALVQRARKFS